MLFNLIAIVVLTALSVGIAYSTFGAGNLGIAGACGLLIAYWKIIKNDPSKNTTCMIMTVFTAINACVGAFPFCFAFYMWMKK